MERNILFLISLFLFKSAFGQDSLQITFTEEPDTLVKQRFIERSAEYRLYLGQHNTGIGPIDVKITKHTFYSELFLGVQQRLFRHGYLDFNTSLNHKYQFLSP